MAGYLLIESRDPFESNDVGYYYGLARGLVDALHEQPGPPVRHVHLPGRRRRPNLGPTAL